MSANVQLGEFLRARRGATDSDFHARAGMGDTKFGDNSWKNDKRLVARQGVDALLAGKDAVVGGDRATKFAVLRTPFRPSGSRQPGRRARLGQPPDRRVRT